MCRWKNHSKEKFQESFQYYLKKAYNQLDCLNKVYLTRGNRIRVPHYNGKFRMGHFYIKDLNRQTDDVLTMHQQQYKRIYSIHRNILGNKKFSESISHIVGKSVYLALGEKTKVVNRSDKLILELLPVSISCGNEIFRKEVSSINWHHLSVRNLPNSYHWCFRHVRK